MKWQETSRNIGKKNSLPKTTHYHCYVKAYTHIHSPVQYNLEYATTIERHFLREKRIKNVMWGTSVNVLKHTHHMTLLEDGNWVLLYSFGIIGYYSIIKVGIVRQAKIFLLFVYLHQLMKTSMHTLYSLHNYNE